jgi:hypothetical protein
LIGPCGLLVVVSHIWQSQFQFYGWGWGEKKTNLGCEKYCYRAAYWAWVEMLLGHWRIPSSLVLGGKTKKVDHHYNAHHTWSWGFQGTIWG